MSLGRRKVKFKRTSEPKPESKPVPRRSRPTPLGPKRVYTINEKYSPNDSRTLLEKLIDEYYNKAEDTEILKKLY